MAKVETNENKLINELILDKALQITKSRIHTPCGLDMNSQEYSARDWYVWWRHHSENCLECAKEMARLENVIGKQKELEGAQNKVSHKKRTK